MDEYKPFTWIPFPVLVAVVGTYTLISPLVAIVFYSSAILSDAQHNVFFRVWAEATGDVFYWKAVDICWTIPLEGFTGQNSQAQTQSKVE